MRRGRGALPAASAHDLTYRLVVVVITALTKR
jgi:hypothetical protein